MESKKSFARTVRLGNRARIFRPEGKATKDRRAAGIANADLAMLSATGNAANE